jgi:SNF2 family DNA or RNA helicase
LTTSSDLELRDYQKTGVEFLYRSQGALLADEMGLGKTAQVICALKQIYDEDIKSKFLIVVPAVLRNQWRREFNLWAPDIAVEILPQDRSQRERAFLFPLSVTITSYEQVRADLDRFSDVEYTLVVLDEAQKIKNPGSGVNRAVFDLNRDRAWVLSGTPIENSLEDLVTISNFLSFGLLNTAMSFADVRSRISPIMLRRTKSEVAPELPEIILQTIGLEMQNDQASNYYAAEHEYYQRRESYSEYVSILAAITELKKICNFDPESLASIKLDALDNILENAASEGHQVIVTSQFVESLQTIKQQSKFGDSMELYYGGMSDSAKSITIDKFVSSEKFAVLLLSLRAGAYGLNIPNAEYVVLFDRWWNPAVEEQAIARAHRLGRRRPLHVFKFKVENSIEDRIVDLLARKSAIKDSIFGEDMRSLEQHITLGEMRSLLTPSVKTLR